MIFDKSNRCDNFDKSDPNQRPGGNQGISNILWHSFEKAAYCRIPNADHFDDDYKNPN